MTSPTRRSLLATACVGAAAALTGCSSPATPRQAPTGSGGVRRTYSYGADPAQVAELRLPASGARGVAVLVHVGYWPGYDRSLEDGVAADLVDHGWAVWNLDYRGVGAGGGWPATFDDVADAVDLLAAVAAENDLSLESMLAVGHSASGTLALWLASRPRLPRGAVGGPRRS